MFEMVIPNQKEVVGIIMMLCFVFGFAGVVTGLVHRKEITMIFSCISLWIPLVSLIYYWIGNNQYSSEIPIIIFVNFVLLITTSVLYISIIQSQKDFGKDITWLEKK